MKLMLFVPCFGLTSGTNNLKVDFFETPWHRFTATISRRSIASRSARQVCNLGRLIQRQGVERENPDI